VGVGQRGVVLAHDTGSRHNTAKKVLKTEVVHAMPNIESFLQVGHNDSDT